MLSVGGQLDSAMLGPSKELSENSNRRRTIYGMVSRHELNPLLRLFEGSIWSVRMVEKRAAREAAEKAAAASGASAPGAAE